jgi:hypothetical protein
MSKSSNRRKTIAIALAVLGIAGLSLASAAQLNLTGDTTVQSGVRALADCQLSTDLITVKFDVPSIVSGGYTSANATLSGIDAACSTYLYKATFLNASGVAVGGEASGTVATVVAPAKSSITIAVSSAAAPTMTQVALTIYK